MNLSTQLAHQFREVQLNGKWVANTNLKEALSAVSWQQATTKIGTLNTIADLTFHINYYVAGLVQVFEGGMLDIRDKFSFDYLPITSAEAWEQLLQKTWSDAEQFARLVEAMPLEKVAGDFIEQKYGTYYRNIQAMIEHSYYHLGQIVLLKKLL